MATINLTATDSSQQTVLDHLIPMVSDTLAEKINNGVYIEKDGKRLLNKKDLSTFIEYATEQAKNTISEQQRKGAQAVCVHGDDIMSWAIHYFEEDSIVGKLFNEDGTEYKPPAQCRKVETKVAPKPALPPKPKSQFSFFDMIDEKKDEVKSQPDEHEVVDIDTEQNEVKLQANDNEVVDNVTQQDEPTVEQMQTTSPTPKPKNELYEKYLTYVNRHPDSVIAMRIGDFYEILGKRAVTIAEEIGLTLTIRDLGLEQRIPMIGFPYHAADIYFKKMRQKHSIVVVDNDGERKLPEFGLEDVIDGDDELTEDEMRQFDGDIQEPKDIPETAPANEQPKTNCEHTDDSDSPYDEVALAKVVKLLGNNFILR